MTQALVKRGYDRLPSVFGWDAFDQMIDEMFGDNIFDRLMKQPQGYPSDLIEIRDENGNVTGHEVSVALAGVPKENVGITVEGDVLNIFINKTEKEENKRKNYLQRGISQRSMQLRYGLHGVDKEKIKASFVDGMLKVELPIAEEVKPRTITIG